MPLNLSDWYAIKFVRLMDIQYQHTGKLKTNIGPHTYTVIPPNRHPTKFNKSTKGNPTNQVLAKFLTTYVVCGNTVSLLPPMDKLSELSLPLPFSSSLFPSPRLPPFLLVS